MNTACPQRKFPRLDLSWIDAELPKVFGFSQMSPADPILVAGLLRTHLAGELRGSGKAFRRHVDLALQEAEQRLFAAVSDDDKPSASLISPFVADIARLRQEQQELRDRKPTRWQRAFPCAFR